MQSIALLLCLGLSAPLLAAPDFDASLVSFRKLLAEMVAADTSSPPGDEAKIVKLVARILDAEKIPYQITEFAPGRQNIVARIKGDGTAKPLLLLAHTDVVGTDGQEWTVPKHALTEKDGYLYGRGVGDDLGNAVLSLETLFLIQRSGVALKRDIIVALTGDEESAGSGIKYILKNHPEQLDAEIALNEGGGVVLTEEGKPKFLSLQVADKTAQDFEVSARGTTGHSSTPLPDNAIYRLGKALAKLSAYRSPLNIPPVMRHYFAERAHLESPKVAAAMRALGAARGPLPASVLEPMEKEPALASTLRTTCVATLVKGGTRENALPASAAANINCRIQPGESVEQVRQRLANAIGDSQVTVKAIDQTVDADPSPLKGPIPDAIRALAQKTWPGVPVISVVSKGFTDSRYLRAKGIAAYGFSPIFNREADARRAHGIDERIAISTLKPGLEFFHQLVLNLAAK